MKIKFIYVKSSNLEGYYYDPAKRKFYIVFINEPTLAYSYANVPNSVYQNFLKASSKGTFFHQNIRNKYSFEKVNVPT